VFNSALSMVYYLRVIMSLISEEPMGEIEVSEPPILMVGVTIIMAILIIALGFFPNPIVSIASEASEALIDGLGSYIGAVLS